MKALGITLLAVTAAFTAAQDTLVVQEGREITLRFSERVNSNTAQKGQLVNMEVADNFYIGGRLLVPAGTKATAVVDNIERQGRFGKNARMQFSLNPIEVNGQMLPLQDRQRGLMFQGGNTGTAAATSVGGALLLGPIGLLAGYGVVGRPVTISAGDRIKTQVSETVAISIPSPPVARS